MGASPGVLQGIMGNAGEIERQNILSQQAQQAQAMAPLQRSLAQEQLTGAQQENQLRAIQMKDASIMGMAMQRNPGDMNGALDWAMQNGASAPTIMSYRKSMADYQKTLADTGYLQSETAGKKNEIAKGESERYQQHLGAALNGATDLPGMQRGMQAAIAQTQKDDPGVSFMLQRDLSSAPNDPAQAMQYWQSKYGSTPAAKQAAEIKREAAQQGEAEASAAQKNQQARIDKIKADAMEAMKANPQSGLASIDQIAPKGPMNAVYKAEYQAAMSMGDMEGAKAAIQHAAEYAGRIAQATNPDIIKADVNKAGAEAMARIPAEVAARVQSERAEAALSSPQLANITDPMLRRQVSQDMIQANKEFQDKAGDAQRLLSFVNAARTGNQAAGSMIPIAEVREIVNRVNRQELQSAGGGSLLRRVENWASTAAQGKPSESTLNDVQQLGGLMLGAAKTTYAGRATGSNQLGAKYSMEPPQVNAQAATAGAVGPIQLKDGRVLTPHSQADADRFRRDHPELIK